MAKFTDEQIAQLLQGRRKIHRTQFPGMPEVEVGVRLLLEQEIDDARLEAQKYLRARCKRQGFELSDYINIDPDSLDRENQRQVIYRAFVDPDSTDPTKPAPFFQSDKDVRRLDSATTQTLWLMYCDWHETINPRVSLSNEQVEELVDTLKKNQGAEMVLAQYAPDSLTSLVRTLANRLES